MTRYTHGGGGHLRRTSWESSGAEQAVLRAAQGLLVGRCSDGCGDWQLRDADPRGPSLYACGRCGRLVYGPWDGGPPAGEGP